MNFTNAKRWCCEFCGFETNNIKGLRQHVTTMIKNEVTEPPKNGKYHQRIKRLEDGLRHWTGTPLECVRTLQAIGDALVGSTTSSAPGLIARIEAEATASQVPTKELEQEEHIGTLVAAAQVAQTIPAMPLTNYEWPPRNTRNTVADNVGLTIPCPNPECDAAYQIGDTTSCILANSVLRTKDGVRVTGIALVPSCKMCGKPLLLTDAPTCVFDTQVPTEVTESVF